MDDITYRWRGDFTNDELNQLHVDAFEDRLFDDDRLRLANMRSPGWIPDA